jgi:hypothetical protein
MTLPSPPDPVFLLTLHRSGGTALARILNCHPRLVIWGEHVGIVNRLAEIDDMVMRVGRLMAVKSDAEIADYAAFPDHRLTEFNPWANPFDHESFRRSCRQMIEGIFTRGLRPGQPWGFKEIRYHRLLTARFLKALFPGAQFVILTRDLADLAASAILAGWSLRWLGDPSAPMQAAMAEAIVRDVTYALLVIERNLTEVEAELGRDCRRLDYRALVEPQRGFVAPLFAFLGLEVAGATAGRIARVLAAPVGGTDRSVTFRGILSEAFIRARVADLAPSLRAEIARDGVHRQRLVAPAGLGQYSFLAGDHTMRDRGCEFSSLF